MPPDGPRVAGAFALASALAPLVAGYPTARLWWVDLAPVPPPLALAAVGLAALALLAGVRAGARVLAAAALADGARTLWNVQTMAVHSGTLLPSGFLFGAAFLAVGTLKLDPAPSRRTRLAAFLACALLVPLSLEVLDGPLDERGPADAAVVFGARVYADGRCSPALADRVRTAVSLHRAGLVRVLVFSGGPGDAAISEPDGMRLLALKLGVPPAAIVLDQQGVSTRATVINTAPLLRPMAGVLAVSHAYHLPRVRTSYAAVGITVRCVPAEETYTLTQMPLLMAREILSLWAHWGRTVTGFAP